MKELYWTGELEPRRHEGDCRLAVGAGSGGLVHHEEHEGHEGTPAPASFPLKRALFTPETAPFTPEFGFERQENRSRPCAEHQRCVNKPAQGIALGTRT